MKPPSEFPFQTHHYGRGRGRTGRFRLSILTKPGWRGTGTRAGVKRFPFPLPPAPTLLGDPRPGTHLGRGHLHPTGTGVPTRAPPPKSGQAEPALAGGAFGSSREEPAGPGASREERLASGQGCEPRAALRPGPTGTAPPPLPARVTAPPGSSCSVPPACHHCCSSHMSPVPKPRTQRPQRASSFIFLMSV